MQKLSLTQDELVMGVSRTEYALGEWQRVNQLIIDKAHSADLYEVGKTLSRFLIIFISSRSTKFITKDLLDGLVALTDSAKKELLYKIRATNTDAGKLEVKQWLTDLIESGYFRRLDQIESTFIRSINKFRGNDVYAYAFQFLGYYSKQIKELLKWVRDQL